MMLITHKEVYEKTLKRENDIRDVGYNLVVIWECEDKHQIKRKF